MKSSASEPGLRGYYLPFGSVAPKDKACFEISKVFLEQFVDLCSKKPERFLFGKTFQLPLGYSYSSVCSEMFL